MPNDPWDYHPDLTAERLMIVAEMIRDGRHTALELYDEHAGDNGWTLGCRAFQFARARILSAADNVQYPWLTLIDRSLQLVFKIGQVPVRIYKGEAGEPTDRTLRQSFGEARQLEMLFAEHDAGRDLAYRFAVETAVDGSVIAVKFVGFRGAFAVLCWDIPLAAEVISTGAIGRIPAEGVALPAPSVSLRTANRDSGSSAS